MRSWRIPCPLRSTPREGKALLVLYVDLSHTLQQHPSLLGRHWALLAAQSSELLGSLPSWSSCSPSNAGAQQAAATLLSDIQPRAVHWTETRHQTSEPEDKRGKKKADTGQVRVFFVTLLYVTSHNCCHRNIMQGTLMVWLYGVLHVPKSYLKYLVKRNLAPPLVLHRAESYWWAFNLLPVFGSF